MKARLVSIVKNIKNNNFQLTFETDTQAVEVFEKWLDKDLAVEPKPWRDKRSLNANAYCHMLIDKIAKAQTPTLSATFCKNLLIGRYGVQMRLENGEPVILKSNLAPEYMLEQEHLHCKVVQGGDEKTWFYAVMKPTHEYDTKEMSDLIDGVVDEAQRLDIETMTPNQIAELKQRYGIEWSKRHEKADKCSNE